jgi:transposase-like protein
MTLSHDTHSNIHLPHAPQSLSDAIADTLELITRHGVNGMAQAFATLMNQAMLIEREQHMNASAYQRAEMRSAYANGTRPKTLDTPAGRITVDIPKTRALPGRDHDPFFPQALERGTRACRAVTAALAQMYVQGVSTRDVAAVMAELGLENVTSSQVSRAAATLDGELEAWRHRDIGTIHQLILDARYEKVREGGVVIDVAVLSAVGIRPDGSRSVLGVSVALSEAEAHWRAFLDSLVTRKMRGVQFIVSDDHAGLQAARRAVLPAVPWQRCQFHLQQNAARHCPNRVVQARVHEQLRDIFTAGSKASADQRLKDLVEEVGSNHKPLAQWLEQNIPQGLTVLALPLEQRKKLRTSNGIERPIQQELKRRTRKIRVFPNPDSLLRLATAILVEIDDQWTASTRRYLPEPSPQETMDR